MAVNSVAKKRPTNRELGRAKETKLIVSRLLQLFYYDQKAGDLRRKVNKGPTREGEIAGCINKAGYRVVEIDGDTYLVHRVVWAMVYGAWPSKDIDHINGTTTDNRIANLREVSHRDNHRNTKRNKNNSSGVTGVVWDRRNQKWEAQITIGGKNVKRGRFESFFEAVCARKSAEALYGFHQNHGRR